MPKVGKTISLHYFANKDIKPKTISWNGEFVEAFPLAASVIYGRSASTIKVERDGIPILVSPGLEQLESRELKEFTDGFSEHVINIVNKEVIHFGSIFKLAGIASRLQAYNHNIFSYITNLTILSLLDAVSSFSDVNRREGTFKNHFQYVADGIRAIVVNGKNDRITVYDWMFANGRDKTFEIINKYFEQNNIGNSKDRGFIINELILLLHILLEKQIYPNIVL